MRTIAPYSFPVLCLLVSALGGFIYGALQANSTWRKRVRHALETHEDETSLRIYLIKSLRRWDFGL